MSMFCFRMDRHEMDDCYAKDSDANEELHDGVDLLPKDMDHIAAEEVQLAVAHPKRLSQPASQPAS